jgi:predicted extracellular nuclease
MGGPRTRLPAPGASSSLAAIVLAAAVAVGPVLAPAVAATPLVEVPRPPEPVAESVPCDKTGVYRSVWEVQGRGNASPYEGSEVEDLRGVVTADVQRGTGGPWEPGGFYLQAHEPDCEEATSDGIFVETEDRVRDIERGDLLEIDGATVREEKGPLVFRWDETFTKARCTEGCQVRLLERGYGPPDPLEYRPPENGTAAFEYNENREGMLVEVSQPVTAVAGVSPYREVPFARGADADRYHALEGDGGQLVRVDGEAIAYRDCGTFGLGDIHTFDRVPYRPEDGIRLYGPLEYSFNTFKIQQDSAVACPTVTEENREPWDPNRNPPPEPTGTRFTVASLNAWNLFDDEENPWKDAEEAETTSYVNRRLAKLANAICADVGLSTPDIVGLQEVENDAMFQALTGQVEATCSATYEWHNRASPDARGIDVGFLVDPDRVDVQRVTTHQKCDDVDRGVGYDPGDDWPGLICPSKTPFYLHSRPPVELVADVQLDTGTERVHLFNNHFKSKLSSSACEADDCTDWRLEQAEHLRSLVDDRRQAQPDAKVVVLGDLNDNFDSRPLDRLDRSTDGLHNLWAEKRGPPSQGQGTIQRYSYVYQGLAQSLDHMLVSAALHELDPTVSPRHLNVDWPGDNRYDRSNPYQSSDHDPLVAGFDLAKASDGS